VNNSFETLIDANTYKLEKLSISIGKGDDGSLRVGKGGSPPLFRALDRVRGGVVKRK
jgi:hypothetical protein